MMIVKIDEWNENINKRDEGGDANGICCTTREDCESINGNVMKNRVGNKERLFETSRKGDLISRHIYISKKTENLFIDKNKRCFCCDILLVVISCWVR
jgi:hypothetical protein